MRNTLIDSGPLVAFLDRRDQWHDWAAAEFQKASDAFQTCDAVLTEACFLLSGVGGAVGRLQQLIKEQALQSVFRLNPLHDPKRHPSRRRFRHAFEKLIAECRRPEYRRCLEAVLAVGLPPPK